MSLLPYQSAAWETHRRTGGPEIDFPLPKEPAHFTVRRGYVGPRTTYVHTPLDTLDPEYDGSTLAVTGVAATDLLTVSSTALLFTGCPVVLSALTGLAGLSAGTYYVIRQSSTTFKLATSSVNAAAGTAVNFTTDGSCTLTLPTAYLVEQSTLKDGDAGQVKYDRLFATVPGAWSEAESMPYRFPAYTASAAGSAATVNALAFNPGNTPADYTLTTSAAHGFSIGNLVAVALTYTWSGTVVTAQVFARVIAVPSTTTFRITGLVGNSTFTSVSGSAAVATGGRLVPEDLVASGRALHEYALSTAADLGTDLPLVQRFAPISLSTGYVVDELNGSTLPTATAYGALVADRSELVAECVHSPYLGNIYLRRTRLMPAQ